MTEPRPTGPADVDAPNESATFHQDLGRRDRRRVVAMLVGGVAVLGIAAAAVAASPATAADPSASAAPQSTAKPESSGAPGDHRGWPDGPFGKRFRLGFGDGDGEVRGIVRPGGVEITAIDGSALSLRTVDGWTRTITVTSDTEITKGGDTVTAGDLAVGDKIRFRQERNDDGSFSITRIAVVEPTVAGTVTSKTGSTITIEQRDGTSVTVHVDAGTSFRVEGASGAADIDDVAVGMKLLASGEQTSDGSLNASRVVAGNGRPFRDHPGKNGPDTSPAPSASPG
ncbi:MAG TPA: DUF5666 domain-containing protein [Candidatus Limnocylindrales bacterium]|nr:DUF5666 domain-containing protein [Candidatus Limnocylindrales bacterium]